MEKKKKKFRPRFLTILMMIVLLTTIVIDSACIYDVFGTMGNTSMGKQEAEQTEEQKQVQKEREEAAQAEEAEAANWNGEVVYVPIDVEQESENLILDQDDAQEVLYEMLPELGIEDENTTYRCNQSQETDSGVIYRLTQYYDDIEVYGYELVMSVDVKGQLQNISGTYGMIENLELETKYSSNDGEKLVKKYLESAYQLSEQDIYLDSMGNYIYFSGDTAINGYVYEVYSGNSSELITTVFLDGNTGDVTGETTAMDYEMITGTLQGQKEAHELDYWKQSEEEFALRDDERNIQVYTFDKNVVKNNEEDKKSVEWKNGETPNASGVDALYHIQNVYDYYQQHFNRMGITNDKSQSLSLYVDIKEYYGQNIQDNAGMAGTGLMVFGTRTNGEPTYAASQNVVGHEYTHGVIRSVSSLGTNITDDEARQKSQEQAINEGLADIFGEFVEDWVDDGNMNNSCDWVNDVRNMSNPEGECLKNVQDFVEGTTDCHYGATIFGHAAYSMAEKVGTQTLQELWYETIENMASTTKFSHLRNLFETRAQLRYIKDGELTKDQMKGILDAFDETGIAPNYQLQLSPNCELKVYDKNNELYDNYHIEVSELYGDTVLEEDVDGKKYTLKLDAGLYHITLTDLENEDLSYTYTLIVNDTEEGIKYDKRHSFYTSFGSLPRDVALVLDCSGSMEGMPMEETKEAAVEFVETVCTESPETRITIIQYSSGSEMVVESSNNAKHLVQAIRGMEIGGGTNMHQGLQDAKNLLDERNGDKQIIVLMSDGLPNEGENDNGDYQQPVLDLAEESKQKDITMYALGFFHNVTGEEKTQCQTLMEGIATSGYYYEVTDAELVQFVFDDIAQQVSGENYIYIRIACPVDVTITSNGETLSSAEKTRNTRTEFGSLAFEGDEDEVKVLRLKNNKNYEVCIEGTGNGTMDYSISFADEEGNYTDERTFEEVPITDKTSIFTTTAEDRSTKLSVDENGDGKFDKIYVADKNEEGQLNKGNWLLWVAVGFTAMILIWVIIRVVIAIRRFRKNRICPNCGSKLGKKDEFCSQCGSIAVKQPLFFEKREPQKKAVKIVKLAIMAVSVALCVGIVLIYQSVPTTALKQIKNQEFVSASQLYDRYIEGNHLSNRYFEFISDFYFDRLTDSYEKGVIDQSFIQEFCRQAVGMDAGDFSDNAKEYLEEKNLST